LISQLDEYQTKIENESKVDTNIDQLEILENQLKNNKDLIKKIKDENA